MHADAQMIIGIAVPNKMPPVDLSRGAAPRDQFVQIRRQRGLCCEHASVDLGIEPAASRREPARSEPDVTPCRRRARGGRGGARDERDHYLMRVPTFRTAKAESSRRWQQFPDAIGSIAAQVVD